MVIAVALVRRDMWFQGDVVQQLLIFFFFVAMAWPATMLQNHKSNFTLMPIWHQTKPKICNNKIEEQKIKI
jgi:hypothetical protein